MLFSSTFDSPEFSVTVRRFDVKTCLGSVLGVSIARWAGCLCPCATQRELSPCPSEGLNWDPRGCRALALHPPTSGAQASSPVRSSRRCRQSHLKKSEKKIKMTKLWAGRNYGIWIGCCCLFNTAAHRPVCVKFYIPAGSVYVHK